MRNFFVGLAGLLLFSGCASEMGRGSARTLYTIADPLVVRRDDIGKDVQLRLEQKIFFHLEAGEKNPGHWELKDYSNRVLLLLSDTPRTAPGFDGFLLQARALGSGEVTLRFTPSDEESHPEDVKFQISVRR